MADLSRLREVLPAYEVGEVVGRGAYGVVIRARHRSLERRVAIKQLPVAHVDDEEARRRLRVEAQVVASLDHPHIVRVYDFVEREDMALFVMEFMSGGTLQQRVSDGVETPQASCAVTFATLAALGYAHGQGVLHRDVKPANILFSAEGVPKLADFGIAKRLAGSGTRTATGLIVGTPSYMSPEQASGGEVGPASDVYSVGAMLYELLSSRPPFESTGGPLAQIYRHVHEIPEPLGEISPAVPEPISDVVMQALGKDAADRPAGAAEFAVALDRAGRQAFGAGWLNETDVRVLISLASLSPDEAPPPTRAPTPTRVTPHSPPPRPQTSGASPPTAQPARDRAATGPATSDRAADPDRAGDTGTGRFPRPWVVLGALAVVVGAVIGALVLSAGSDEEPTGQAGETEPTTDPAVATENTAADQSDSRETTPAASPLAIRINFQSAHAPVADGYLADFGQAFGERTGDDQGEGHRYGWVAPGTSTPLDMTAHGRDRGRSPELPQRLDTLMHFRNSNPASGEIERGDWEIAVPDGEYIVTVGVGDITVAQTHTVVVEGTMAIDGFQGSETGPTHENNTVTVEVTDGRLTLAAPDTSSTKINYVDIRQVG